METESTEYALETPFYFKDFVDAEGKRVIARTRSLRYVCCICKRQFKNKKPCIRHLDVAHNVEVKEMKLKDPCAKDAPSNCSFCSKTFLHRKNMFRHVRMHHPGNMGPICAVVGDKIKKEACPICDKTYCRISAVNRHIRRRHSVHVEDNQPDVVPCHFCEIKFPDENSCSTHMSNYHHAVLKTNREGGEDEVLLCCTLCEEKFSEKSAFKQHLSFVHGEDLHEFCVEFTSEAEEVGDNSNNFNCEVCNLSFNLENLWRCHMKEYHKAFPDSCCQRCGACSFRTVHELNCHLKEVHNIDKKIEATTSLPRRTRAEGSNIGLSALELRVLEKIPEWLVKHGDGKLLLAIYK